MVTRTTSDLVRGLAFFVGRGGRVGGSQDVCGGVRVQGFALRMYSYGSLPVYRCLGSQALSEVSLYLKLPNPTFL